MADRQVRATGKDKDGDITKLCNSGSDWSPRKKDDAINDIEKGTHRYYVILDKKEVDIKVVKGKNGKYLRTDPDKTTKNNLEDLPDC
jgi:hypothetical protein